MSGKSEMCDKILRNLKRCDDQKNLNCKHYQNLTLENCVAKYRKTG